MAAQPRPALLDSEEPPREVRFTEGKHPIRSWHSDADGNFFQRGSSHGSLQWNPPQATAQGWHSRQPDIPRTSQESLVPGYAYCHTNTQQSSLDTGASEQSTANDYAGVGNAELAGQLSEFQCAGDMAHDGWGTAMAASTEEFFLEELVGDDFAAGLDFVVDGFHSASGSLTQLLPDIATADPAMGQTLDSLIKGGEEVFGDVDFLIEEIRDSASFEGDRVVIDQTLLAELDHTLSLIEEYTYVIGLAEERWTFVLSLPDLQMMQAAMLGVAVVNALMIQHGERLIAELTSLQEQLNMHQRELAEAEMKMGVDTGLIIGSVALALTPLSAPVALAAGVGLALTGLAASLAIEGGLSNFGVMKGTVMASKLGDDAAALAAAQPTAGLKGLGPALNVISLALDTMEASEEYTAISDIKSRMESIQPAADAFIAEWPKLETSLTSVLSSFVQLKEELSSWADRVDVIDQELAVTLPQFTG